MNENYEQFVRLTTEIMSLEMQIQQIEASGYPPAAIEGGLRTLTGALAQAKRERDKLRGVSVKADVAGRAKWEKLPVKKFPVSETFPTRDMLLDATIDIRETWEMVTRFTLSEATRYQMRLQGERLLFIDIADASYISPEQYQTYLTAIREADMTKTTISEAAKRAISQASSRATGQATTSGQKSTAEIFNKVPKNPSSMGGVVGTVNLPVDDVMAGVEVLEIKRRELLEYGINSPEVEDDLAGINPDAVKCLRLVKMAAKRKQQSAVTTEAEWNALDSATQVLMAGYTELENGWRGEQQRMKGEYVGLAGEHGSIWLTNTVLKILTASVKQGKHVLLTGEPGTSKTDTARALAAHTGRALFHFEVSGLSDVSQLEQERYIEERNGASVTTSIPTALIDALEAHAAGESVLLVIDEIARVTDPAILNPLMLLMSHGEFHAVVGKKIYTVTPERFCIVATANIMLGYNFSGNSRRGMDDALLDRFRIIQLTRPPVEKIRQIVSDRVPALGPVNWKIVDRMMSAIEYLYGMASDVRADDNVKRLITVRTMIDVTDGWVGLDPQVYSLGEAVQLLLTPKAKTEQSMTAIVSGLETKGL